jgi:hypothetical protein
LLVERCTPGASIETLPDDGMLRRAVHSLASCTVFPLRRRATISKRPHGSGERTPALAGWMERMRHSLSVRAARIVARGSYLRDRPRAGHHRLRCLHGRVGFSSRCR